MRQTEEQAVRRAIASTNGTREAATKLGCSQRTLIRRMKVFGIEARSVGRPQIVFITEDNERQLTRDEGARWRAKTFEQRFLAVEEIREATATLYQIQVPKRLARSCGYITETSGQVSRHRWPRTRNTG